MTPPATMAIRFYEPIGAEPVTRETEAGMALFRDHADVYGYAFYVLRARD